MPNYTRINPQTAKALIDKNACVVDIRDFPSYQAGHIAGATHLSNESLPAFLAQLDREQPIIVCCYHGNSSQQVAAFFAEQGVTESYSLDGGYGLWASCFPDACETDSQQ